jgi:hypothetical protein
VRLPDADVQGVLDPDIADSEVATGVTNASQ